MATDYLAEFLYNDKIYKLADTWAREQLVNKADNVDIQELHKQVEQLKKAVAVLESKPNGNIPAYTEGPTTLPSDGTASLFIIKNSDGSMLCCRLADGTLLTLAPVTITDGGLQLTLSSPLFTME